MSKKFEEMGSQLYLSEDGTTIEAIDLRSKVVHFGLKLENNYEK